MALSQINLDRLRRDPRVPLIFAAIIALIFIFTLWGMINNFRAHYVKHIAMTQVTPIHSLVNIRALHLFGVYIHNLADLPATQLQLTLTGTVVSLDSPGQSRALIASPGQPTKVYQVGDMLPGNATITRVAKHHVVINDNGTLEKLSLPVEQLNNNP